jgi:hypothetical protein
METKVFVGVDVCKDSLDVAIGLGKDIITFANDQKGVDALLKKLSGIDAELTVFESTGGYELLAASSLAESGLPVVNHHYYCYSNAEVPSFMRQGQNGVEMKKSTL